MNKRIDERLFLRPPWSRVLPSMVDLVVLSIHKPRKRRMRKPALFLLFGIVAGILPTASLARTWLDVDTYHSPDTIYPDLANHMFETDPLWFTLFPSEPPSAAPSMASTGRPTITPEPTTSPSTSLSDLPTSYPSVSPTTSMPSGLPSDAPSDNPTLDPFPEHDPPENATAFNYFNYDDSPDSIYGPGTPELVPHSSTDFHVEYRNNAWQFFKPPDNWYWREFDSPENGGFGPWEDVLSKRFGHNDCANVGQQSPIDVVPNGAECLEHHQIRTRRGDLSLKNDTEVEKIIESNKLRLKYMRRPCSDYDLPECLEPDPPTADFPNQWGGHADAMHVDFKVPSEHTILGERFDGEMQIYHMHPSRRRTPAVSVMMQTSETGYNPELQRALNQFQIRYDFDRATCARKMRTSRRRASEAHMIFGQSVESKYDDYETWADFSTHFDDPNFIDNKRDLQFSGLWNPHNPLLVPSFYFYGYEGSITEPPCNEFVSWFVIDTPMKLHPIQLAQMKRLIFTYTNPDCEMTSSHYRESVARPIQDSYDRPVWHCTRDNFPPDIERERDDLDDFVPSAAPFSSMPSSSNSVSSTPTSSMPSTVQGSSMPSSSTAGSSTPVSSMPSTAQGSSTPSSYIRRSFMPSTVPGISSMPSAVPGVSSMPSAVPGVSSMPSGPNPGSSMPSAAPSTSSPTLFSTVEPTVFPSL